MIKTKIALIGGLLGACVVLTGCFAEYTGHYSFLLERVERPEETKQRYGREKNIFREEDSHVYEDNLMKIQLSPTEMFIFFSIENKADYSIKILWDEVTYVDENAISHRVMHRGVSFYTRNQPQAPSVIPPGSTLTDRVSSADCVLPESSEIGHLMKDKYGTWRQIPMLPVERKFGEPVVEFSNRIESFRGKRIGILIPLEIEGVRNEYTFVFLIKDAWVREERGFF